MESRDKEKSRGKASGYTTYDKSHISVQDSFSYIEDLVNAIHTHHSTSTYEDLLSFLRRWWCKYYKRPYKDPLLNEYTIEELYFEFLDLTYDDRNRDMNGTSTVPAPTDDDYKWAEEMEASEGNVDIGHAAESGDTNENPDNIEAGEDIIATF